VGRWGWVRRCDSGQSLVEFALVLPVLMLLIVGLVEFALVFNARDSVFVVLDRIERDIVSPARPVRVQTVKIFWSDKNGVEQSGKENLYTRAGSTLCTYGNGTSLTVPYTLSTNLYPEADRCDVLAGCGAGHPGPDNIGVTISYTHNWVTSVAKISLSSLSFNITQATRVEPQQ
jgi:hypothetical protein